MRSKRPFRSLIVCVSCAMVGCILASTAYSRRVDELEIERDIYASRFQNWQTRAIDAEENVGRLQTEVDNLTAELNAQTDLTLTYAGSFSCTAYCAEEYATHAEALSWSGWGSRRVWIVTAGGDADADT